jgi:hypothetical protein
MVTANSALNLSGIASKFNTITVFIIFTYEHCLVHYFQVLL